MKPVVDIGHTTAPNRVLEDILALLVARGDIEVTGAIGERIKAKAAALTPPKKLKPVFKLTGGYNPRHPTIPSTVLDGIDWHEVNQALGAMFNDGYETVTVRREMVPE
jgi:hypothetical protein